MANSKLGDSSFASRNVIGSNISTSKVHNRGGSQQPKLPSPMSSTQTNLGHKVNV